VFPSTGAEIDFLDAHTDLHGEAGCVGVPSVGISVAVRQGRAGSLVVSVATLAAPR
jgi:hypothetical protein